MSVLSKFVEVFWKLTDTGETDKLEQYHRGSCGGSVASSSSKTTLRYEEEISLFQERLLVH